MKKCSKCKKIKPAEGFYKDLNTKTGLASRCKICHKQACKKYRKTEKGKMVQMQGGKKYRNSRKGKQLYRAWRLNNNYGLTINDYNEIVKNQNNLCAICGLSEIAKQGKKMQVLSVDHNHNTRRVRGLLCRKCNQALGLLEVDDFGILNLQMAIKYLGDK